MSSIYTPRPAYQDLGGSIVLLSIVKRFPTFLHCEALFLAPNADLSQARVAASPLEFRDAVASLPVNAVLAPVSAGVPLTLYVSKPGFEEDFKEVAGDIAVTGYDLVRAAPDAGNPFFLIFGRPADLSAAPLVSVAGPTTPVVEMPRAAELAPLAVQPSITVPPFAADLPEAVSSAPAQPAVETSPAEPVVVPVKQLEQAAALAEVLAAPTVVEAVPAVVEATPPELEAAPAGVQAALTPPTDRVPEYSLKANPEVAASSRMPADAEYAELREQMVAQAQAQALAFAQTQAVLQELAQSTKQQLAQSRQDLKQLLSDQQAAPQAALDAKLTQMQEQMANRQLAVARQAEAEQTERQMASLRHLQQEQATQLQALLVKLQNEQSEWQQETFNVLERNQKAQQQAQVERPAWFAAGTKELGRAVAEQGEGLQAGLKAQQDQIIALQKTISEWRSQKSARVEEPMLGPELGTAVSELAWKVEKGTETTRGISTRLGLLFVLNLLVLAALAVGFVWSTSFYGASLATLQPTPAPTYADVETPMPTLAVSPEPTVVLTGVALNCAETNRGRVYYDCTLGNGVAYPQTLSLSITADGGRANGFFPSVTLDSRQIFPDPTTTLASLGRFEIGQPKHFRLNLPCAAALGCAPTTFVVRVVDSQALVVPGSEILITSASPAP